MAVGEGESPDPAAASLWGLVRSAQAEHPGRFALIDAEPASPEEAIEAALGAAAEPQLAIRAGQLLAPRLTPAPAPEPGGPTPSTPRQTVLITGGLSGIGALVARHLASDHGARHLLLLSRRGPEAPGAEELEAELAELGAEVRIAACDVSDRQALAELLGLDPRRAPPGGGGPLRGGARRRHDRLARPRAPGAGLRPQGRRRLSTCTS